MGVCSWNKFEKKNKRELFKDDFLYILNIIIYYIYTKSAFKESA